MVHTRRNSRLANFALRSRRALRENYTWDDMELDYENAVWEEAEDVKKVVNSKLIDYGIKVVSCNIADFGRPDSDIHRSDGTPAVAVFEVFVPDEWVFQNVLDVDDDDIEYEIEDAFEEWADEDFYIYDAPIIEVSYDCAVAGGHRLEVASEIVASFNTEMWLERQYEYEAEMAESRRRRGRMSGIRHPRQASFR